MRRDGPTHRLPKKPSTLKGDLAYSEPKLNCPFCPRLVLFREAARKKYPGWHNAPVPSFGPKNARLLIIGLAPGLKGANRTGRPFTGDFAGSLLYKTMLEFGFARGSYDPDDNDNLELTDARITNAVRCVPPANKPTPEEVTTCRMFLIATLEEMPQLEHFLVLGRIAHETFLRTFNFKLKDYPFAHGKVHNLPDGRLLFDSYHCSRYNTQTGRLTAEMFRSVFKEIRKQLSS
jgi:uracil-DNA glycosylase family 4